MICFSAKCENKKCNKTFSTIENKDFENTVVEIFFDFQEKHVSYSCPYCGHYNKILIGVADNKRLPPIGGSRY